MKFKVGDYVQEDSYILNLVHYVNYIDTKKRLYTLCFYDEESKYPNDSDKFRRVVYKDIALDYFFSLTTSIFRKENNENS